MHPQNHILDKRAEQIAALAPTSQTQPKLITSKELASWLGVSLSWVEKARAQGYGPPFIRLTNRNIRYECDAVVLWLSNRTRLYEVSVYGEATT